MGHVFAEPRNKNIGDEKDLPVEEVERKDGLPTVKDLKDLMKIKGKGADGVESTEEDDLDDFIQVIIKIKK